MEYAPGIQKRQLLLFSLFQTCLYYFTKQFYDVKADKKVASIKIEELINLSRFFSTSRYKTVVTKGRR